MAVNLSLNQTVLILTLANPVRKTWITQAALAISLCEGLFSFNSKGLCYCYAWSCRLCEAGTFFCVRRGP